MITSSAILLLGIVMPAWAFPHYQGVRIAAPPKQSFEGLLRIPEPSHPYVAPKRGDLRGPCPGLNTLANHGYLPRNGVASFEEIVNATTRGFNMDYDFSTGLTAFAMLGRGNPYTNQLSIGGDTPLIPPLPGNIDGPKTRGLSFHGRFEGDVSMTRQDAAIGDSVKFQPKLFAELLDIVAQVGDDSDVTGPKSVVNIESFSLFKQKRFQESQAKNKELDYHFARLIRSYGETSIAFNFFANGTDGVLSVPTLTSIFRDERFPHNWYRRSSPGTMDVIGQSSTQMLTAHPVASGANAPNGTYIVDPPTNLDACTLYNELAGNIVPGALLKTRGLLKENVDFLLDALHKTLGPSCPVAVPHGPANV